MISCIILAAGLSNRFGSPKPLAEWHKETLIEHLQRLLLPTSLHEIVIVLGSHAQEIKPLLLNHNKIKLVYNKDYNFGQTSSFKEGLKSVSPKAEGVMLWPVDYPAIKRETVNLLVEAFIKEKPLILIPTHKDKKGHPPIFSATLRKEFLRLVVTVGVNSVFYNHSAYVRTLEVNDPGVVATFNTPQELEELRKRFI